nr:hypothetical protein 10 [Desulfobulbaceae bacterium]
MNNNPDLERLIKGLNELTVCSTRLCGFRGNGGQHEQIRFELQQRGLPAYQNFQQSIMQLALRYFPELGQR